jgi:hypothetical protein
MSALSPGVVPVAVAAAAAPRATAYRPRRPQNTVLHRVVRDHFETFLAQTGRLNKRPLPRYVIQEFEKYLACGDLARGHVKVVCSRCGLARVVPFSCKTRRLCLSCSGRWMADSAARLVDSVLPDVPLRQWVLTLPFDLRLLAAARADVLRHVVRIFVQTILRGMRRRLRVPGAADGAIAYQVRHPIAPGKKHRVMTPLELLARLAAIVPPPR